MSKFSSFSFVIHWYISWKHFCEFATWPLPHCQTECPYTSQTDLSCHFSVFWHSRKPAQNNTTINECWHGLFDLSLQWCNIEITTPQGQGWTLAFCPARCSAERCLDSWRHNTAESSWRPQSSLLRSHQRWGWSDCWTLLAWCGRHCLPRRSCSDTEKL